MEGTDQSLQPVNDLPKVEVHLNQRPNNSKTLHT